MKYVFTHDIEKSSSYLIACTNLGKMCIWGALNVHMPPDYSLSTLQIGDTQTGIVAQASANTARVCLLLVFISISVNLCGHPKVILQPHISLLFPVTRNNTGDSFCRGP